MPLDTRFPKPTKPSPFTAIRIATAAAVVAGLAWAAPAGAADPATQHGIAMHGDLKYPADFTHFDYVNPNAPKGGKVRLSAIGSFDTLNGFTIKGTAAVGLGRIYDSLLTGAADEAFSSYGLLAEAVELPEDRSWVAFTLRPTARWHDGKPITVDDVIFTFNMLKTKGAPFYRFYYAGIANMTQTAPRTVRFDFAPGENRELPLIVGQAPILPKHYWADRDFEKTILTPPLGSGPYKIGTLDPGRSITYERVADYWGTQLPINRGRNNFDVIQVDYYRDRTVALEAFKAGGIDYWAENASKNWATAYDIPAVKDGRIVRNEVKHGLPAGMQGFVFNTRRALFADPKVRHALAYGFDFNWSNKNLFYSQYTRTRSYFDNSELAARGLPDAAELALLEPFRGQIPDAVFTTEYNPPATNGSGRIRKSLRAANDLLKAAGWVIKDKKRVNGKTGAPLAFEILLVDPQFERIVLPFAKNLERLGIDVKVRSVDSAQYQQRLQTYDFDMIVGSWGQSLSPGNEQRNFWGSAAADQEGGRNLVGIKSAAIDGLIERLIAAPDRQALITATQALDRVLQWGHYVIPNWHISYERLAYWNLFGVPEVTPMAGSQFNAWWVDKAAAQLLNRRD